MSSKDYQRTKKNQRVIKPLSSLCCGRWDLNNVPYHKHLQKGNFGATKFLRTSSKMKFCCFYSMSMLISIREINCVQGAVNLPLRIDTDVLARLCDYFKCSITDIIYYMANQKMNIACYRCICYNVPRQEAINILDYHKTKPRKRQLTRFLHILRLCIRG